MPKYKGSKSAAAKQREAHKKGNTPPEQQKQVTATREEREDPAYLTESDASTDSEENPIMKTAMEVTNPRKRQYEHPDADIFPEVRAKYLPRSSTEYRNRTGGTKKARAKNMQPSIASIFKKVPKTHGGPGSEPKKARLSPPEEDQDVMILDSQAPVLQVEDMLSITAATAMEVTANQPDQNSFQTRIEETVDEGDGFGQFGTLGWGSTILEESPQITIQQDSPEIPLSTVPIANPDSEIIPHDSGPDNELPEHGKDIPRSQIELLTAHKRLSCQIKRNLKKYRSKKIIQTDNHAAEAIIDLNALEQYNDEYLELSLKQLKLQTKLATASRLLKPKIKGQIRSIHPATDASASVARRCSRSAFYARRLRQMAAHMQSTGELHRTRQGKDAHHDTLLDRPGVRHALERWFKGELPFEKGGFKGPVKPAKLRRYLNDFLLPEMKIQSQISESTANRWMKKLGFKLRRVQKGIYVDGHERPAVVKSREEFLNYMYREVLPYCYEYVDTPNGLKEVPPKLQPGQKIHYPIFHDETCVHANDQDNFVWVRDGEQPLREKSRGRIVHVSDFIIEHCGRLSLSTEQKEAQEKLPQRPVPPESIPLVVDTAPTMIETSSAPKITNTRKATQPKPKKTSSKTKKSPSDSQNSKEPPATIRSFTELENEWIPPPPPFPHTAYRLNSYDARRIIHPGSNGDPWWDMPQLIAQTKDTIELFNHLYPDGVAVFIFDCSSAHEAFSSDALLAHKMNRGPGGKQPKMRDTVIPGTNIPQSMVFSDDYQGYDKDGQSLAGKPKGMEQVLRERGLLEALKEKHGSSLVLACKDCKMSQAKREKMLADRKARREEIDGSGVQDLDSQLIDQFDDSEFGRSKTCCMQRVLSLQDDFLHEKPLLQLIIEKAGHKCLFLPKFHCELNPIEMVWSLMKSYFKAEADGTFPTAKTLVPECLDRVSVSHIRKYFRHCYRYMDAYKKGLNLRQAEYAVKKYTSHRRIPASILMDVNILVRAGSAT